MNIDKLIQTDVKIFVKANNNAKQSEGLRPTIHYEVVDVVNDDRINSGTGILVANDHNQIVLYDLSNFI